MNNDEQLVISPRAKLVIFGVLASLSVVAWVVFKVVLMPKSFDPDDFNDNVSVSINPSLRVATTVQNMEAGRVFTDTELASFGLHVLDDTKGSGTDIYLVDYQPSIPYDIEGYRTYTAGYRRDPNH